MKFFPNAELPDEIQERIIGMKSVLFLDIASYTIIAESSVSQYHPDYAYNHPLYTNGMLDRITNKKHIFHMIRRTRSVRQETLIWMSLSIQRKMHC